MCLVAGFAQAEDAAVARDRMALALGVAPDRLNFPDRNLKPATVPEIRRELRGRRTDRYLGVRRAKDSTKFFVTLRAQGRVYGLFGFETELEAASARDRLALWLNGPRTDLNFPDAGLAPASFEELKVERDEARRRRASSRYRGVSFAARGGSRVPWMAVLERGAGQKPLHLGRWTSERGAALAVDRAALHIWGDQAKLAFPAETRRLGPASAEALRDQARREFKKLTMSRYQGVWPTSSDRWSASILKRGRKHHLGSFNTEEQAARAYDRAAIRVFGDKARLNFARRASTREP